MAVGMDIVEGARAAYAGGDAAMAKRLSEEALEWAQQNNLSWQRGNCLHWANIILGHLALDVGDYSAADRYLAQAGGCGGSPQLNSFGPDLALANRLLKCQASVPAVSKYLVLCGSFWKGRSSTIQEWVRLIRGGQMPALAYCGPDEDE